MFSAMLGEVARHASRRAPDCQPCPFCERLTRIEFGSRHCMCTSTTAVKRNGLTPKLRGGAKAAPRLW